LETSLLAMRAEEMPNSINTMKNLEEGSLRFFPRPLRGRFFARLHLDRAIVCSPAATYGMIAYMESGEPKKSFAGLRVLSLESRRGAEMAKLIANHGGAAVIAPSMREVPLESNTEAAAFGRKLIAGEFDMVIFLTGVGTRALAKVVETIYPLDQYIAELRKLAVVARGPKPAAVLKEWNVPIALTAPEPNTWRELLRVLDENAVAFPMKERRVAVQEYGVPNTELIAGLAERGAQVTTVPVYEWALPADTGPLRSAIAAIARNEIDVILFTTATQADHLLQIAAEMNERDALRRALLRMLVASIGPTTSERLREFGIAPDMEPTHPKMGYLVSEAAQRSAEILRKKRIATN
jgi:uroporphyrinogen-III synthase